MNRSNAGDRKPSILIVEDEVIIALDLKSHLEKMGYTVLAQVNSAEKALELTEQNPPDLVLMDIILKGKMDGIAAAEIIRSRWGIPVVLCTAYADQERLKRAKLVYPFGYLIKPFQDNDIKVTVEMALFISKMERERRKAEEGKQQRLQDLQVHQIELEMQNEELKMARLALEESRQRIADLYDFAPVGYFTFTQEDLIKEVNLTGASLLGVARQQLINRRFRGFIVPSELDLWDRHFLSVLQQGERQRCDLSIQRQDGSAFPAGLESIRKEMSPGRTEVHTVVSDITERKTAEKALRESQEYFKAIIQNSSDIILIVDKLATITYASPSIERFLGYEPDELIGKRTLDLIVPDDKSRAIADFGRALLTKDPFPNVFRLKHKNGTERILEGIGKNLLDNPFVAGFVMNVRDVTERQRTEEALQQSEKKYRTILESIEEGYFEVDLKGCFTFFNDSLSELLGYSRDELMGKNNRDYMPPRSSEEIFSLFNQIYKTGRPVKKHVYEVIKKDGTHGFHELNASLMRDENGKPTGFRGIAHDITDHKRVEEAMQESAELLKNYLENAPDGIYMSDLQGNFLYGNRKCEEITGYRREELIGKNFLELNLLSENSLTKAIQLLQANMEDGPTGPDEIELISKEGLLIPVEINTNVVQRSNQKIVIASVRDITERKQASMELRLNLEKLRKALGGIIEAMALTVETRDPYTSGHQRRVADLARSIAQEMGLLEEQVNGLRMAGIVHDLGKISIPAEILSKPTQISNLELSLIKVHPQAGYNILKDIDFPWPLAEIVLQHHERMDGSGYPQGLLGANILLEARILAVADVVEAIASHRPYRPALGIDAALEELEKNRGLLYDAETVDACLKLFREKGYHLD